jgi:hypothetical protein
LAATSRSEKSENIARERKSTAKAKARPRSRTALKPKPAPKRAQPRIKYRHSETMRLFCQRAGKATPECRIFRRNAPRKRR